ncbi:dihydrofolate reductase family protein [Pseudactinotalea suaedae]|uniref:dihydrofolate reductase family protein n=1 Tax=Pseudactinotalea suaedae TaxID=1524924 RepID=UPI0012E1C9CB|nr:dihydrofolate reductase family protein [Pseudactinotalea suaedae]
MTRYRYNTATTLDGFLADDADSLDWLLKQEFDEHGPGSFEAFMAGVGTQVMGATTYEWILDHEKGAWTYTAPTFVFTHRDLEPANETITMVAGAPAEHRAAIEAAAGDKDVWMVGGGDLAASFAAAGMLDEILVGVAPVTLGSGRPLLGGAYDLRLEESDRNHEFLVARYAVVGPLGTR